MSAKKFTTKVKDNFSLFISIPLKNLFIGIGSVIREFFFSYDNAKDIYKPSSRKFWATYFSSIGAYAYVSKFIFNNQNITSTDLTILSSLITAAIGWYALGDHLRNNYINNNVDNIVSTDPSIPISQNPNEMYIEDNKNQPGA